MDYLKIVKQEIDSPEMELKIYESSINEIKIEEHSIENDIMDYQHCVDTGTNSRDEINSKYMSKLIR